MYDNIEKEKRTEFYELKLYAINDQVTGFKAHALGTDLYIAEDGSLHGSSCAMFKAELVPGLTPEDGVIKVIVKCSLDQFEGSTPAYISGPLGAKAFRALSSFPPTRKGESTEAVGGLSYLGEGFPDDKGFKATGHEVINVYIQVNRKFQV